MAGNSSGSDRFLREAFGSDGEAAVQCSLFMLLVMHEISGRLSIIKMHTDLAQILVDQDEKAKATHHLMRLSNNILRIEALNKDLTQLGKMQCGQFVLRRQRHDLREVCLEASEEHSLLSGTQIEVDVPDEEVWIEGDPERIHQVLCNLLSNAHKYSQDCGKVRLSLRVDGAEARTCVQDDGPGIAQEHLGDVFEPFFRGTKGNGPPNPAGLGLGLYICRMLVEAHGGRIWAESAPGEGTVLWIALPRCGD